MDTPIFDCFDLNYKSPFGAIRQYQPSTFSLRFPKEWNVSDPTLVMFRPGEKERFIPLDITDTTTECNVFTCNFNPLHKGLHHYYFSLMIDGNRRYIKRSGARLGVLDNGELFQLTVFDKDMAAPDWIKGGIMYQIFPDRFCRSGEKHENVPTDRIIHENWEDTPFFRPDNRGIIRNNDYFAGDFKGIESKLPYLQSLGVTCIYLNPVFESHENHRYSTACYEHIDPMLGTDEDFEHLCKQAKTYGIDIILDGVFSHTGADSIYFNKFGRYGEHEGAYRDPDSKYKNWYCFSRYPFDYESWWGITTLPNVNENNPDYTEYICGENGILQRWIDKGARGWRLDVADELPDEFLRAAYGLEELHRDGAAHKLCKIGRTLQLPFESCRADLKIVAVRHGVLFIEDRIERAGNGLTVGDIHAAVLVDVQAQEPFSALADIFHIPERTAVRLHDRFCKLRHLLRYLHEKSPLPARKSGEQFPTLK